LLRRCDGRHQHRQEKSNCLHDWTLETWNGRLSLK
jgi:hypothetical protein